VSVFKGVEYKVVVPVIYQQIYALTKESLFMMADQTWYEPDP